MAYRINPIPDMECQRIGLLADLTCGRYCLKSLLKYWHQKSGRPRADRITIPKPASRLKDWMAYDPMGDYQHAAALLVAPNTMPTTMLGWEQLMTRVDGPIILGGTGLGGAFAGLGPIPGVPHAILLIGANAASGNFMYLDPLVGNVPQTVPFQPMQNRIDDLVHSQPDIAAKISVANHPYYTVDHIGIGRGWWWG